MWRTNSDGELYLYAPKDKQTPEVCNTPPRSICEADYGLSIGRGSFRFTPGQWTHVSQTVVLNTPGKQDGYFTLDVNGERIMDLSGLYYRQIADEDWDDDDGDKYESERVDGAGDIDSHEDSTSPNGGNASGQDSGTSNELEEKGGLLGHILAAPSKIDTQPNTKSRIYSAWSMPGRNPIFLAPNPHLDRDLRQRHMSHTRPSSQALIPTKTTGLTTIAVVTQATKSLMTAVSQARAAKVAGHPELVNLAARRKVPGFSGIFFSTFFGGHTPNFATPKDQKIWFKDFSLTVND
ncbi:unnamed protein product [Rhizoctonia solani]|nr:unnamed protein product [Rhizoctonia solani]